MEYAPKHFKSALGKPYQKFSKKNPSKNDGRLGEFNQESKLKIRFLMDFVYFLRIENKYKALSF